MTERALVTGGAGFIGLNLARALLARGVEVTLIDDLSRGQADAELEALLPGVTLLRHDLRQPIDPELVGPGFTQVYHFAAVVGVATSMAAPLGVLRTNLLATIHLLDLCARLGPAAHCFASTSEVYAGTARCLPLPVPTPEEVPLCVDDPGLPRISYGASKIAGEALFAAYARQHLGTGGTVRIVRYHNVYGPRMGYDHVIPQLIVRLGERPDPFPIYGAQRRAFCYVDDAVEATLRVMALADPPVLTVNVGNDREEIAVVDLAQWLFDLAGFHPRLEVHPAPPGSPERRCPDLSRLRRLTGWEPGVPLADGLRTTYAWYSERSPR